MRKYYAWCMTINNPVFEDYESVTRFDQSGNRAFMVVGREGFGPVPYKYRKIGKVPTPHLQMFVVCNREMSFYEMKEIFKRAHIEPARKFYEGFYYCFKEGYFEVYGNILAGWEKWMIQKKKQPTAYSNKRRENIEGGVSVTPASTPDDSEPFSLYGLHSWETDRLIRREDDLPGYWND